MIIECIWCKKKFEVNSDLIPISGRTIQCGSCDKVWFFQPKSVDLPNKNENERLIDKTVVTEKKRTKSSMKSYVSDKDNKNRFEVTKYQPKSNYKLSKLLSYILVTIISFVALIILIDTFKSVLYDKLPNLELLMFSLFETLKDIQLFIKDLIQHD